MLESFLGFVAVMATGVLVFRFALRWTTLWAELSMLWSGAWLVVGGAALSEEDPLGIVWLVPGVFWMVATLMHFRGPALLPGNWFPRLVRNADDPLLHENPYELVYTDRIVYRRVIDALREVFEREPMEGWDEAMHLRLRTMGLDRPELAPHLIALALDNKHDASVGPAELVKRLRAAGVDAFTAQQTAGPPAPRRTGRDRRDGSGA